MSLPKAVGEYFVEVFRDNANGDSELDNKQYRLAKKEAWEKVYMRWPEVGDAHQAFLHAKENKDWHEFTEQEKRGHRYQISVAQSIRMKGVKQEYVKQPTRVVQAETPPPIMPEQPAEQEKALNFSELYRAWIDANDYIPSDTALAHFAGTSVGAVSSARYRLRQEGYEIDGGNDSGWIVKSRPQPDLKEVERISAELYQRLSEIQEMLAEIRSR